MQIQQQPEGWSEQRIDQLLGDVSSIESSMISLDTNTATIAQHTANMNEFTYVSMHGDAMLVFVLSTLLGYWLSAIYMPAISDMGGGR